MLIRIFHAPAPEIWALHALPDIGGPWVWEIGPTHDTVFDTVCDWFGRPYPLPAGVGLHEYSTWRPPQPDFEAFLKDQVLASMRDRLLSMRMPSTSQGVHAQYFLWGLRVAWEANRLIYLDQDDAGLSGRILAYGRDRLILELFETTSQEQVGCWDLRMVGDNLELCEEGYTDRNSCVPRELVPSFTMLPTYGEPSTDPSILFLRHGPKPPPIPLPQKATHWAIPTLIWRTLELAILAKFG